MKILLTGKSGFLGKYIFEHLVKYDLKSLGRSNCDYNFDIKRRMPELPFFNLVIHAAGKAHLCPKTKDEVDDFYNTNHLGTLNLLKSLENNIPERIVYISSVSVYGVTSGVLLNEDTPLLAKDPYGLSKINAEVEIIKWSKKNNVKYTILRLPLIVGYKPPGNLGSMYKAIEKRYYANISGGKSKKSMVMAVDVAKHILLASEKGGIFNLTDGYNPTFNELSKAIALEYNHAIIPNIPNFLALLIAKVGDFLGDGFYFNTNKFIKITSELTFSDLHARKTFNWNPNSVISKIPLTIKH
jgi:nucleoside-diphosphate-sugar epimerase